MIDFLDLYLDVLVLTPKGIVLFMRNGLFYHKTDIFEWAKIETISHTQRGFWDKILLQGDLMITLEHGVEYPFERIASPNRHVQKLLMYKQKFGGQSSSSSEISDEKLALFAEAL